MSILIKGMEMPTSCGDCKAFVCYKQWAGDMGDCFCGITKNDAKAKEKNADCPLIELPPHGRLIDADEISEHKYTTIPPYRKKYADGKPKSDEEIIAFKFGWNYAIDAIVENAPTIIPASDKDTNVLGKEEPTHPNASNTLNALREEGE